MMLASVPHGTETQGSCLNLNADLQVEQPLKRVVDVAKQPVNHKASQLLKEFNVLQV